MSVFDLEILRVCVCVCFMESNEFSMRVISFSKVTIKGSIVDCREIRIFKSKLAEYVKYFHFCRHAMYFQDVFVLSRCFCAFERKSFLLYHVVVNFDFCRLTWSVFLPREYILNSILSSMYIIIKFSNPYLLVLSQRHVYMTPLNIVIATDTIDQTKKGCILFDMKITLFII